MSRHSETDANRYMAQLSTYQNGHADGLAKGLAKGRAEAERLIKEQAVFTVLLWCAAFIAGVAVGVHFAKGLPL